MEDLEARLCWRRRRRGRRRRGVVVAGVVAGAVGRRRRRRFVARVRDQAAQRRRRRRRRSLSGREEREAHAELVGVPEMQRRREVRSGLRDRVFELVGGHGLAFGDPLCNGLAVGAEEQTLSRRHRIGCKKTATLLESRCARRVCGSR